MVSSTGLAGRRPKGSTENWKCLFFIFKKGKGCSSVKVPSCEQVTTGNQDNFQLIQKLWKWISNITPVTLVPKMSKSTAASPQSYETGQIDANVTLVDNSWAKVPCSSDHTAALPLPAPLRTQWEGSYFQARKRTLTRNWICWYLDLGHLSF